MLLGVLLITAPALAEVMTFEKEVEEIVANDQSREQVELFALQKAKRLAVEEAGTYISSLSIVSNAMMQKDEITALASGVVQTKIVGLPAVRLENGVVHVYVKARIQVDTGILDKQVAELLKEKGTLKKLEAEQKKVRDLENRLLSLKSTELKRLEELNVLAVAMEQERDRRRLANAEMALKALGELKKAEIERLQKDRALNESTAKMMADQEQQRKNEAAVLAQEQDRIRRAQLENEQRWNDLARKSQLSQQQWVAIDDSLSLKQALAEVRIIKGEIATLKQRSEFQYEESIRTLKTAYQQQIAVTRPKMTPSLAEKDPFESTATFKYRRESYDAKVKLANEENTVQINKLEVEESQKLSQTKMEYMKQQIKVLRPFIKRLKALQAGVFVLPGEQVTVGLGEPDADRSCFPTIVTHKTDRWTMDWKYSDTNKARDIYRTRNFLKGEAMVQLADTAPEGYVMIKVRISHPGSGEQQSFVVANAPELAEISDFDKASGVLAEALRKDCPSNNEANGNGFIICSDLVLDGRSGLMWARNANIANLDWNKASEWIQDLNIGGFSDWRLPTKEEFKTFAERGGNSPLEWFTANGFYGVQDDGYWTGSTYGKDDSHGEAWYLHIRYGNFTPLSRYHFSWFVWPVSDSKKN